MPQHIPDPDGIPWFGSVGLDTQDARVDGFDLLDGLVTFDAEQGIAGLNLVALLLQPSYKATFLHGPT